MNTRHQNLALLALAAVGVALLFRRPAYAPDGELTLIDGKRTKLRARRGRPVPLSFWATTCAPCLREIPDLAALHRDLRPRGLDVFAVAMDYDPPMRVLAFAERHALPYRVALDLDGTPARAFDVSVIPHNIPIGPDGRIVYNRRGSLDRDAVQKKIESLFTGSKSDGGST